VVVVEQGVITEVRAQGRDPQHGGQPVALRPGRAVLLPDPGGQGAQDAEHQRQHQAAAQRRGQDRAGVVRVQEPADL
jgi:hypothetical protein